jgi:hypothetical protein
MGKELTRIREQMWKRCGGYCERCGIPLTDNWAMHHRKLRSRGGKNDLSNLVAVHHECHNLGTNSIHLNPAQATEDGFMVASWEHPADIPILYAGRDRVLLSDDGSVRHFGEKASWQESQQSQSLGD